MYFCGCGAASWLWRRRGVEGVGGCRGDGVEGRRVDGVEGRRAALRAEPTHPVPVGCLVPQFVGVFASRDYLPSPSPIDCGCTVLAYRTHTSLSSAKVPLAKRGAQP